MVSSSVGYQEDFEMQLMDFEEFLWPKVRLLSDKIRVIEIISLKNIAERLKSCHVANYIPETGNAKLGTFQYCQFLDGQILAGMIKASLKAIGSSSQVLSAAHHLTVNSQLNRRDQTRLQITIHSLARKYFG